MNQSVSHTVSTRKPRSNPLDYSKRELDLMMVASCALLGGRKPNLSADELAEAGGLLEELDAANVDPERFPYTPPGDQDPQDDEHEDGCTCWMHDDEPAYHADDAYDMHRDRADDGWAA